MVSIKDVARKAGVAISTVSKVLNGYPNVSLGTKDRVEEAIKELHYIPNSVAAALSSKQSGRVALLVEPNGKTQAIDEICMQYLTGALDKAKELGMEIITIFLSMIASMSPEEIIRYLSAQNITGLIIYGMSKDDGVLRRVVEEKAFYSVLVDAPLYNEMTSSVWIDQRKAQYEVAKKTIEKDKCRKVLYIAGRENGYVTRARLEGMEELARELGLALTVKYGNFSELEARNLTFQYAAGQDVVVCASDLMAIGAMNALTEMDIFRPVCGFDGITLMGYVGKQMNTVRQDFYRISETAVEEMKRLMSGEPGRQVVLDYSIVKLYYRDIIC